MVITPHYFRNVLLALILTVLALMFCKVCANMFIGFCSGDSQDACGRRWFTDNGALAVSLRADSGFYASYMIRHCQCEGYCDGSS